MLDQRLFKLLVAFIIACCLAILIYVGNFCPERMCVLRTGVPTPLYKSTDVSLRNSNIMANDGQENVMMQRPFKINGEDVIVFIHIQKTGGSTFGKHLVQDIALETPCECTKGKKRCNCLNEQNHIWLFSRFSTGWICGLHADWTELTTCVNDSLNKIERLQRKRRLLFITILRHPEQRYLSEWKHVQRGSTWMSAKLKCDGRQATLTEVPFCFNGEDWSGVSLDEFMSCPDNLANNRQTRMLANLSLIGCYNHSLMPEDERNQVMLASAKNNLKSMPFFGLTEYQSETQLLFEETFNLKFIKDFVLYNDTHAASVYLTKIQKEKIYSNNKLDMELYLYAKQIFLERRRKGRATNGDNIVY